jgi:hypothetical protein
LVEGLLSPWVVMLWAVFPGLFRTFRPAQSSRTLVKKSDITIAKRLTWRTRKA